MERDPELGQRIGALWKEYAVAVDIEFKRQSMLGEGGGQEVVVGQEILGVVDGGTSAHARAVVEQVQEGGSSWCRPRAIGAEWRRANSARRS